MSIWLIGAGQMAQDYAKVLQALGKPFRVIGRGFDTALEFEKATGQSVEVGGLSTALASENAPAEAIVAVGVEQLASAARALINAGTQRILLEKPGALNSIEISELDRLAKQQATTVLIAYNRRFYHSVNQARSFISEDGGLLSAQFEFTEWSHKIAPLEKAPGVKERWLLANSSHVIDLAFHLCGAPRDWRCWRAGSLDWHPASARFAGAGITDKNVMFSYISDWEAPGRWGIDLLTPRRRLIFRPMEQLRAIRLGDVKEEVIEPSDSLDQDFKPGLYRQTMAFLGRQDGQFCSLSDQVKNERIYSEIAGYP